MEITEEEIKEVCKTVICEMKEQAGDYAASVIDIACEAFEERLIEKLFGGKK